MAVSVGFMEKTKTKIKEPGRYKVVMYNDDFTPMDFVVSILEDIFDKNHDEAVAVMLAVHKSHMCVVGEYTYDIAKTKVALCVNRARALGYPFRVEVKE